MSFFDNLENVFCQVQNEYLMFQQISLHESNFGQSFVSFIFWILNEYLKPIAKSLASFDGRIGETFWILNIDENIFNIVPNYTHRVL
jgi:hypothetical protein